MSTMYYFKHNQKPIGQTNAMPLGAYRFTWTILPQEFCENMLVHGGVVDEYGRDMDRAAFAIMVGKAAEQKFVDGLE